MVLPVSRYARAVASFLEPSSAQERDRRAAHALALVLVGVIAATNHVSGLTLHRVPFTLYVVAIAASAVRGGLATAAVATLASVLVTGMDATPPIDRGVRLLFGVEGFAVGALMAAVAARKRRAEARLASAEIVIHDLERRDRHGRVVDAALRHLEASVEETAVVVLNDTGMIVDWRPSAERLYGYSSEQVLGLDVTVLFSERASRSPLADLLREAVENGAVGGTDLHRRQNGSPVHVEFEMKPFRDGAAEGFTFTAHDVARRREWEAYRDAAVRAQTALQKAADDAKQQLAALESLIDPSLNPLGGPAMVAELLERLRSTVGADGAALVQTGAGGRRVIAAHGLQPRGGPRPLGPDAKPVAAGRVTLIHNDPDRVEETAALRWSRDVSSLMVVPLVHNGQVWSTIEVVSERPRRASDWDVALMRITADRLAAVAVQEHAMAAKAS
jgi:PAS domain S-box-containing protein